MAGRGQKILKLHWLNCPKTVPRKQNLDQKINDSKPNIWSLFINFRFSGRKTRSQQKLAKKITKFTIQFCSENIIHVITPQLTQFTPATQPKLDTQTKNCILEVLRKQMYAYSCKSS